MTVEDNLNIYNIVTMSLREILIPDDKWIAYVKNHESYHDHVIYCEPVKRGTGDQNETYYFAPYPYNEPFYVSLLRAKHPDAQYFELSELDRLTNKEYQIWANAVADRISSFSQYALPDTVVSFLDSDPNIGVFIHSTTGEIVPFEYDKLDSVSISKMRLHDKLRMIKHSLRKDSSDSELHSAARYLSQHGNMYDMWYCLTYRDGKGDIFNDKDSCKCVTTRVPLTADEITQYMEYINSMVAERAKCIILP